LCLVVEHAAAGGIDCKRPRLADAVSEQFAVLGEFLDFVLLLVALLGEYRGNVAPRQIVEDTRLNMVADCRAGGGHAGSRLFDRSDAPVAGRANAGDEHQAADGQTEELGFDRELHSVRPQSPVWFLHPQFVAGIGRC
jgi:hypothetical protein